MQHRQDTTSSSPKRLLLPYKDPTSPNLHSVDIQTGFHASSQSLALDIKPNPATSGDGKPTCQSTVDKVRDVQSHTSINGLYLIGQADCFSEYSDIRGDICRGDENVSLGFIVFISDPVLQEPLKYLKYLKAQTPHLNDILQRSGSYKNEK
ncbi:uncharacterized protein BDCG_17283 [Blastomyces dermatitidis ER-3]|uniref:Uncharacterized protein n=1 Tax=Ajellomyces dermatitidis (strain ER-3 / ATCC MYA-2586) TaxID=559297 RepID=A0ABX2VXN6_AJEDR|nr:uncharacterized protein BDCG_17283 [Blastomyces dermatitidis ER-3]OAT01909.1 hypothetical protein BDCG_17283 [Blastomyces dermatitidis ER-3]